MAQPRTPPSAAEESPRGDPWHAVGSLVAGVGVYGLLGWCLDQLLGTSWLVAVGIVLGAVLGLYATWARFMTQPSTIRPSPANPPTDETRQEAR